MIVRTEVFEITWESDGKVGGFRCRGDKDTLYFGRDPVEVLLRALQNRIGEDWQLGYDGLLDQS